MNQVLSFAVVFFMLVRYVLFSAPLFLLIACSPQQGISVENAWIPEPPPTVQGLAGYMEVENHFSHERVLIGAESPVFQSIQIHRTVVDEQLDLARMVRQSQVVIAAGQILRFEPGGFHLMLLNPSQRLEPGQTIPVILHFANGSQHKVNFIIRKYEFKLE